VKERTYVLHMRGPEAGAKGFPGQWSPELDPAEQIPGISVEPKPNETETMNDNLTPLTPEELAGKEHKDTVRAVEGVLATLYDPRKETKAGKPIQYPKWEGVLKLSGGKEFRIEVDAEHPDFGKHLKGKRLRFTCKVGPKGLSGLHMDRYADNAKYHHVAVTKTAIIEEVGSSGQPTSQTQRPKPEGYEEEEDTPKGTKGRPSQSTEPAGNEPVEIRVANKLRIFRCYCDAMGRDYEATLAELSADKMAEWATGTEMSFKEGYIHRAPYFASEQAGETMARTEALVERARKASAEAGETTLPTKTSPSKAGWKEFEDRGTKLGDMEQEQLAKLIRWANDKKDVALSEAATALRSQLLMADAELRGKASHKVSAALAKAGLGDEFTEEEAEEVLEEEFGVTLSDMNYGQLFLLGNGLAEFVAKMKAKHAPPPKKAAKPPVKKSEEDDMPD
jgi:hypothetical protein